MNGHWIVTPFQKVVEFAGTMLEYTGSNTAIERINSTKPLQKKLLVQVGMATAEQPAQGNSLEWACVSSTNPHTRSAQLQAENKYSLHVLI